MSKRKIEGNSDYQVSNSNKDESSYESCAYMQKEKKIKRKQNEQITYKNKKQGPWTKNEEIKFINYVQMHIRIFQDKDLRRRKKIFRQMAKCIKSRSSEQCRSHHQKYQIRFISHQNMIEQIKQKIKGSCQRPQKPRGTQIKRQESNMGFGNFQEPKPAQRVFSYYPTQRLEDRQNLYSNISSPAQIIIERGQGFEILQKSVGSLEFKVVLDLQKFFA